ncbi:DUF4276 family protein [Desulfuromonas sp. TF]|uniref:DUF4276 family protein n=1 Tax=Desulfuromonas sp. TF TaxID=1232410 RepID=UPI000426E796|nr:DUF4276 family protein [Desulfuromonas sp. TF]
MKIGFIVECGPKGAETQVLPLLAALIRPEIIPDIIPLDRKPLLKEQCGRYAAELLARGCEKVLIVWDLLPDWGEYEGIGCLHADREEIFQSLQHAGLRRDDPRIAVVCIHKMLEAWLRADDRALARVLSTDAHPVKIPRVKTCQSIRDPKAALDSLFRQSPKFRQYTDYVHAVLIARKITDLTRLNRVPCFNRFREAIEA